MQKLNIFQYPDLPYEPLPRAAYDAARTSILRRNFPEKAFLDEYSFSTRSREHTIKVNTLVFAHSTHRNPAEYASFTIYNAVNGQSDDVIVRTLAESAAPFHIIHRGNQFSFWASSVNRTYQVEPIPVQTGIAYDQLDSVLSKYADDLQPQRIINVKQGRDTFTLPIFRDNVQPLQLSLWAADVTRKLLVEHFAQAVEILRKYARKRRDIGAYDKDLTSLAIQLLGALILADTGALGDEMRLNDVSMRQLIQTSHAKFERYFQLDLFENYYEAAKEAYLVLRQIRYAGFVPDMLSDLYTKAYSKEQRRKLGRFDTPLYLTRRILENIPVEYLPPDQRIIADMTGGWGSFLIAGYERLSALSDMKRPLREQLRGNDIDPFTAQLEGLGLLLSTLEDSWYVDHEDALDWNWLKTHEPNIIVGNPPFETTQHSSSTEEKGWHEKANKFLQHAIERLAPNGYLAMLMPCSFTTSLASPQLRKQLLETCDIFELWELPIEVFKEATAQTVVVFAKKSAKKDSPFVRIRTLQPNIVDAFKSSVIFTASGLVNQSRWIDQTEEAKNKYKMEYRIVLSEQKWQEIRSHCTDLEKHAEFIKGASIGKPENRKWKNEPSSREVGWLTGVKKIMPRPFFIDYGQAKTIKYPNDLERPRKDKESILAGTKVLLPYDPHPSWGKRNKVAIERKNHYVSDSFWVVAPNARSQAMSITCEVLAAILNWDVSNAWIVEHLKSPTIPKRALETIPFPKDLSEHDCHMLTEAVRKLEEAAALNKNAPFEVTQTIDTILKRAYRLDDATFERLRKVIEWDEQPQTTFDPEPDRDSATWIISGIVDSINAEQGTITLWMEGFRELQTVQIVPAMPGWLLRPNAAFRTKIPHKFVRQGSINRDTIDWGIFQPQPYAYMSEEELLEELGNLLQAGDKNRI
jgi:type I restriction-modification system DNA methylase subunit